MVISKTNPLDTDSVQTLAKYHTGKAKSALANASMRDLMDALDESEVLRKQFVSRNGDGVIDELRQFAHLQTDLMMVEMRQIQLDQYKRELLPGWIVFEIRDSTNQLVDDILGPAYSANLEHYGVPRQIAVKAREDFLRGLNAIYTDVAMKAANGNN